MDINIIDDYLEKQDYVNEDDLGKYATKNNYNVISMNINGIKTKLGSLEQIIRNNNIDLICVQEVGSPNSLAMEGYKCKYITRNQDVFTRTKKKAGGLAVFSSNNLIVLKQEIRPEIEYQICEVEMTQNRKLVLCNTYIPPEVNK